MAVAFGTLSKPLAEVTGVAVDTGSTAGSLVASTLPEPPALWRCKPKWWWLLPLLPLVPLLVADSVSFGCFSFWWNREWWPVFAACPSPASLADARRGAVAGAGAGKTGSTGIKPKW